MKRLALVPLLSIAALSSGEALALPDYDLQGWYGGIDLARAYNGISGSSIDQAFSNQGITTTSSIDKARFAWGANLGYRFNDYWALEGGYYKLGAFSYSAPATAPAADTITGTLKATAWYLAPVGYANLSQRWALFGKAGITRASVSEDANSQTGATTPAGESVTSTGWLLGGGATYDFSRFFYGKIELDRYGRVGDPNATGRGAIDMLSLGVGIRFF